MAEQRPCDMVGKRMLSRGLPLKNGVRFLPISKHPLKRSGMRRSRSGRQGLKRGGKYMLSHGLQKNGG